MLLTNSKVQSTSKQHIRQRKTDDLNPVENAVDQPVIHNSMKHPSLANFQSFSSLAIFIAIVLLFLHMYLCYKLYAIDRDLSPPDSGCRRQCHEGLRFDLSSSLLHSCFSLLSEEFPSMKRSFVYINDHWSNYLMENRKSNFFTFLCLQFERVWFSYLKDFCYFFIWCKNTRGLNIWLVESRNSRQFRFFNGFLIS